MESPENYLGTVIDRRYRLTQFLGRGSYGYVFEGAEEALGQYISRVAVKIIAPRNEAERDGVLREVRGLAQLSHESILAYRTAGEIAEGPLAGHLFVVTELAETSLEREMKKAGAIAQEEIHRMALSIAQALHRCHARQAVHGDVKPANILRVNGRWKLADFGLVRSGQEAASPALDQATIAYMAPEVLDHPPGTKADVYSFGVTLLETLTGELAHHGSSTEEFLKDLATQPARIPEALTEPWKRIVERCLNRDPEARASALEIAQELGGTAEVSLSPSPKWDPETLVVSCFGHGDCLTLRDALERVRAGSRIVVQPGRYRESLVFERPVEIVGDGPVQEIVLEVADSGCIQVSTEKATIRGLTIRRFPEPASTPCYTVDVPQGTLLLQDCTISGGSLACIAVHGAATQLFMSRCKIERSDDAGIFLYDRGHANLEQCNVFAHANSGISVGEGAVLTTIRSRIHHGRASGVYVARGGRAEFSDCDISNNGKAGVAVGSGGRAELAVCRIHDNGSFGVWAESETGGTIRKCILADNPQGAWHLPIGASSWIVEENREAKEAACSAQ